MSRAIITAARPRTPDSFLLVFHGIIPDLVLVIRGIRVLLRSEGDAVLSISCLDGPLYAGMKLSTQWENENQEHEGLNNLGE
ncbi:hypothetical protein F4824DRAFT_454811 [Ustulina deusta]|nr:hypothetical protein F4824DRAFT_454811 [Ustulina deusta]